MIWTKANRIPPPLNIPLYVVLEDDTVLTKVYTEENMVHFHTLNNKQKIKETLKEEDPDVEDWEIEMMLGNMEFVKFWSFIPLLPPDEIMPALSKFNEELTQLKITVQKLKDEIISIPRITSIQRQIEALQIQISHANPDSYHQWKEERIRQSLNKDNQT